MKQNGYFPDPRDMYQRAIAQGNTKCINCGKELASFDEVGGLIRMNIYKGPDLIATKENSDFLDTMWRDFLVCKDDECLRQTRSGRYAD